MASAFDNGHTYADSKADAVSKAKQVLADVATSCPSTKFTMVGYSQGADAAGDIASAIGNGQGPIDASRVLAVGLLADPGAGTKGTATVGPRTSGQGIADPRPQGWALYRGASPRSAIREICTARSKRGRAPCSARSDRS